jgi:hypothetical protein
MGCRWDQTLFFPELFFAFLRVWRVAVASVYTVH